MHQIYIKIVDNYRKQAFPFVCIILYVIFTCTDLYTTYLSTPDLRQESNPVYQYFQWGWTGHITYTLFMIVLTIFFSVISNNYILQYFEKQKHNVLINRFLFVICFLFLVYCFHNLIATFECSINNYLGYRYSYLPHNENIIQKMAVGYVNFYLKFGAYSFMYIVTGTEICLAALITFFQIRRVKKYVQCNFSLPK